MLMAKAINKIDRRISVAPMMACTDRHYRYFARLISKHTLLYSEMVSANAIIHGDRNKLLGFNAEEHPVALQLGGSDPQALAICAKIGEDFGYDEINLNVGCPSDRVQSGQFGACLMKMPTLVANCVAAMTRAVSIPVTVKIRIGVDDQDSYPELCKFITEVATAGCTTFIVHARKAWLSGLSPKDNRNIPPLRYEVVYQLKRDFPELEIIINGGIKCLEDIDKHLAHVDGVMIGREAYSNPWLLASFDQYLTKTGSEANIKDVILAYLPYIARELAHGAKLRALSRHLIGLFQGQPGARHWRRYLSEHAGADLRGIQVVKSALELVEPY